MYSRYVKNKITHIVGVDEAGRGPLAGPVAVGVAVVRKGFDWRLISGVTDSKKISEKKRNEIFRRAKHLKKQKKIDYAVTLVGEKTIDRIGISNAVRLGIQRCFKRLSLEPQNTDVRLDGLLHAPGNYKIQKTIPKGDSKEKTIGLASILAKVRRDNHMIRVAKEYPKYDLHIHKGYGTEKHRKAIKKHGLSQIHRKYFCKNIFS